MGKHDGHRERVREKIAAAGLDTFQDHEVLEYILFHCIPRKNTNEIGHELIDRFGSFADVLNSDKERLKEVPGMTEIAALFLSVLPDIMRRYLLSAERKRTNLSGRRKVRDYIAKEMYGAPVEIAGAAALDAQDGLIRFRKLNHPGVNVNPSQEDVELTRELAYVLDSIGVRLLDHIIYAGTESFSFAESGLLGDILGN